MVFGGDDGGLCIYRNLNKIGVTVKQVSRVYEPAVTSRNSSFQKHLSISS